MQKKPKLYRAEWNFDACPDDLLQECLDYERAREIPEIIALYRQEFERRKVAPEDFPYSSVIHVGGSPHARNRCIPLAALLRWHCHRVPHIARQTRAASCLVPTRQRSARQRGDAPNRALVCGLNPLRRLRLLPAMAGLSCYG